MKEVPYEKWTEMIKELNAGQPSVEDLVQRQIDSYEEGKEVTKDGEK